MSSAKNNVKATAVIFGATGNLGFHVSKIFLTEYRWAFSTVRIVTRDPSSSQSQELAKHGGEVVLFDEESLDALLADADVVLNVIPPPLLSSEFKTSILHALVRNGVNVYFPSEYGAYDYMNENAFPGHEPDEWQQKRTLQIEARRILADKVKIVNLNGGGLMTAWVGPGRVLNWDADENVYSIVGPGTVKISLTHPVDVARAAARLAVLALDPETAGSVPRDVRIAAQSVSYEELRDMVARVKGIPKGEIVSRGVVAERARVEKARSGNIWEYCLVLFGEGKFHFVTTNNELVNPGESLWKWRLPEDEFRR